MAVVGYLVSRSDRGGDQKIDSIQAMIVAIDDTVDTSSALIKARGVTVANAAGHDLPDGYFDTATALSTFDAAGDNAIFGAKLSQAIA